MQLGLGAPHQCQDYENSSMAYVELHGDAVACVKGPTGDLVTDAFFAIEGRTVEGLGSCKIGSVPDLDC